MSNEPSQVQQMKPYILIAGVVLIILLAVWLWPTQDTNEQADTIAVVSEPVIQADQNDGINDIVEPQLFEAPPRPNEAQISPNMEVEEFEAQEVVVEIPVDVSDAAIKTSLMAVASSPTLSKLLVNDRLIEKFVINVHNLANAQLSPKDTLVVPPSESFKTYAQADRTWIDNSTFQRYNSYVDAFESLDTTDLLAVFDNYENTVKEKFAEISRPGQSFDQALVDAIDTLLDTPKVPVPIEVYTDSVMFKFKDERLENLSGPQKQLLRTGPENMRRIKDVLRTLKQSIEDRNE
jgi:hypothetical protein